MLSHKSQNEASPLPKLLPLRGRGGPCLAVLIFKQLLPAWTASTDNELRPFIAALTGQQCLHPLSIERSGDHAVAVQRTLYAVVWPGKPLSVRGLTGSTSIRCSTSKKALSLIRIWWFEAASHNLAARFTAFPLAV